MRLLAAVRVLESRARADNGRCAGKDLRWIHVQVATIFSRLAFAVVAGRQRFPQACCQPCHDMLNKRLAFHNDHGPAGDASGPGSRRRVTARYKKSPGGDPETPRTHMGGFGDGIAFLDSAAVPFSPFADGDGRRFVAVWPVW